jgi:hypothetical protein
LQGLNTLIEEQASQMKELKEKKALSWHLNYYKKKFINGQLLKKAALLPLDKAIIKGEGFT